MAKADQQRTAGGYALARTGKEQAQIAREVGVSKVTVHQWINGQRKPAEKKREVLTALYGITAHLWDELYKPPPRRPPIPDRTATKDGGSAALGGAFAMARALQRQAESQLDELESADLKWAPAEKAQVTQRLASTINVLAKITGQYELGRRLLKLPQWKLIEKEMFEALKPFPEAAAAVADRLERFEREWLVAGDA